MERFGVKEEIHKDKLLAALSSTISDNHNVTQFLFLFVTFLAQTLDQSPTLREGVSGAGFDVVC